MGVGGWGGWERVHTLDVKNLYYKSILNIELPYDLVMTLLDIYSREIKT